MVVNEPLLNESLEFIQIYNLGLGRTGDDLREYFSCLKTRYLEWTCICSSLHMRDIVAEKGRLDVGTCEDCLSDINKQLQFDDIFSQKLSHVQQGNARLLGIIQEYFKSGTPPILPDVLAILKQTVQIHKAQLQQIAEEFKDICHTVTALFRNIEQTMEQNGLWNLMPKGVHTVSESEGLKKLKDHRAIPSFDAAAGLAQLVVEMERLLKSLTPVTICRNAAEAQFIEGLRQMYTVESERMVLMKVMNIPGSRPAGATAITDSTGSGSVEFF